MKWRATLNAIAATRYGFFHTGSTNKLSFSDSEFMALNISTTTKIDKLIVVARCAMTLVNISHPISGNSVEHWWKWVCENTDKYQKQEKGDVDVPIHSTRSEDRPHNT